MVNLTFLIKDYDYLAPIVYGEVEVEGVDLDLIRDTPSALDRTLTDTSIDIGELSLSRHLLRIAEDDHSFVGIPFFVTRAFRQRCFFVRRDSGMSSITDLVGKRVGTNEWQATGNTWARAVLREQGVEVDQVKWVLGSVDGVKKMRSHDQPPPHATTAPEGSALIDMLLEGELDALMVPLPPPGFGTPDSQVVRLFPDFRAAEQDYYRRTGLYPAHHIVGIRRAVFDKHPWVAASLFTALCEARNQWRERRQRLTETTPWILAEFEESAALMGEDWAPEGLVDENIAMVQALIDEQIAQGLTDLSVDVNAVFAEWASVAQPETVSAD